MSDDIAVDTSGGVPSEAPASTPETTADVSTQANPVEGVTQPTPTTDVAQNEPQGVQNPAQAENPNARWDSPENPYFKRFNDAQSHMGRLYNQYKQYADTGLKPDEIQKIIEERKQREAASNLKPWNKGHEGYSRYTQLKSAANEFRTAMQKAGNDPVKQEFVKEMYQGRFNDQDLDMIRQAEIDRQDQLEALQSDPKGFIAQHVQDLIQQHFNQYEQYQTMRSEAQSWFSDPNKAPLIQKYGQDMARIMDQSVPMRDKAVEYAQMKAELEALRAKVAGETEQNLQTQAKQDLLGKGQRSFTRTPKQAPNVGDPVKYLTEKGFEPGTIEFARELAKLNSKR